jgi:hypothetical protein
MAHALRLPNFVFQRAVRREQEYNGRQWSPVKSLQSPTWLKEIYDRISGLAALEENWDSYGGLPVAPKAISMIRVVLSNLDIEDMPRPHVAAIPDGGIGLHWRVADRDLEVEVEPNGDIHFLKTVVGAEPNSADVDSWEDAQAVMYWVLGR